MGGAKKQFSLLKTVFMFKKNVIYDIMNLESIIIFVLISISFSVMWSLSDIMSPLRNFTVKLPYIRRALLCPECSSFWIGLFVSVFIFNPFSAFFLGHILSGLVSHFFALFLYKTTNISS